MAKRLGEVAEEEEVGTLEEHREEAPRFRARVKSRDRNHRFCPRLGAGTVEDGESAGEEAADVVAVAKWSTRRTP